MSVPEFSVKRPVFIGMCASIVVILGGVALKSLPVDLMPEITYPAISINTTYEDASPEEVEQLISRPIEETVSAVSGVDTVSSSSSEGTSSVVIEFTWGTNLDEAASDVRDRIDRIIARLPDDADRPTLRKFDSASTPIVRLGIGTDLDLMEARELLDDQVVYRLERIDGVASATISGGLEREIQILFDRDRIKTLELTLDEVLSKIQNSNVTTPAGNLKQNRIEVRVRTPGIFNSIDEISDILRTNHKLKESDEDDFSIRSQQELASMLTSTTDMMTILLAAVAGISLLVGGIGIMNIMYVSVTERTREIGLRMSIGAKGRDILAQFLIESILISVTGGLIGVLFGIGAAIVVNLVAAFPIYIQPWSVFLSFAVCTITGIFFGWYPAQKAAMLDPIEAIRYE